MSESSNNLLQAALNAPPVMRTRKNHGLEHATLHILSRRRPGLRLAGHSNPGGFWLIGNVPTDEVESSVQEALRRLRAGEYNLAIHPNCGTNLVTIGMLGGLAGALAMLGAGRRFRDKLGRLPLAFTLATLGAVLAQPLGARIQERVTTFPDPGTLEIDRIIVARRGGVTAHRILTRE